jgi:hypothetical protein
MCSTLDATPAPVTVAALSRLVEHARDAARAVTDALAGDPTLLAAVPDELLEVYALQLHDALDASEAAATVVTGRVESEIGAIRGKLISGRYPSTAQFLEREAGVAPLAARARVARGRDLGSHSTAVADAWLTGEIPGGAVRDLTLGVTDVLRRSSRTDRRIARQEALDQLMPVARASKDPRRVTSELARIRFEVDPDGSADEARKAFEDQTLSIVEVGSMSHLSAWLPHDAAAAVATVLERRAKVIAAEELGPIAHDDDCDLSGPHAADAETACTCGEADRARRAGNQRQDNLRARALVETMQDLLDDGAIGTHHGVRPNVTVIVDATDLDAALSGALSMPGRDHDVPIPEVTVRRLLCDADVTRVITQRSAGCTHDAIVGPLAAEARSVLYVGRSERVVSPRLRRALETRDRHCAFPGCHAHVRRCQAHHVTPWEDGGPPTCPTSRCSASPITTRCTRAAGRCSSPTVAPGTRSAAGSSPRPSDDAGPGEQGARPPPSRRTARTTSAARPRTCPRSASSHSGAVLQLGRGAARERFERGLHAAYEPSLEDIRQVVGGHEAEGRELVGRQPHGRRVVQDTAVIEEHERFAAVRLGTLPLPAQQTTEVDAEAELLLELPPARRPWRLVELHRTTGELPRRLVRRLHDQHSSGRVTDEGSGAHALARQRAVLRRGMGGHGRSMAAASAVITSHPRRR